MKNKQSKMQNRMQRLDIHNRTDFDKLGDILKKAFDMVSEIKCHDCRTYHNRMLALEVEKTACILDVMRREELPVYLDVFIRMDFDPNQCSCNERIAKGHKTGVLKIELMNAYGSY